MRLSRDFYRREDVTQIAKDLLGKVLHTQVDGVLSLGKIVETEAYSYKEKACHAYMERNTNRTKVLFMDGGTSYVYLCYGIHNLFNVVTNVEGKAEAVLIRAIEPVAGVEVMQQRRNKKSEMELASGPGKLSEALGINRSLNEVDLTNNEHIWIEDHGEEVIDIEASPRIGVAYAEEDALLPWRYVIKESKYVSKGNNSYK
ncbi:DNA-3-methyladenine glycosylase [Fulvivirga sp. RKSG066]|uniref:DNA-3-methyladenine glycosylase n=1 Tax=Fulvivirga aurantia TaxID=2529383 RepID=UPI0012BD74A2|nr:DNA-3-methyladenine glycosylase [Fulvivirga aurantia]MTI20036.1 DNA-3-methyladenine glycosylase [Fulvivirga aurantia]